jgi:PKD repeat protein
VTANCTVSATFSAIDTSSNLVAYYPFNGNANDESGNGNNGTVNGATLTVDRFGNENKAYSFDHSRINFPAQFFTMRGDFAINGWIKSLNVSIPTQTILTLNTPHAGFALALNHSDHPGRKITMYVSNAGTAWDYITEGNFTNYQDNTWYFISIIKKGNSIFVYNNGVQTNTVDLGSTPFSIPNAGVSLGGNVGDYFIGALDDFRIYNRALTATEVGALYNDNAPAPPVAPAASFTSAVNVNGPKVNFDAAASSDQDGTIVSYAWNFGDSTTGSGAQAIHYYSALGTYTVTLTVTDNAGLTGGTQKTVVIGNRMPVAANLPDQISVSPGRLIDLGLAQYVSDPDGDTLTYNASGLASLPRASFDAASGRFTWLPSATGTYSLPVSVSDGHGGQISIAILLKVESLSATGETGEVPATVG